MRRDVMRTSRGDAPRTGIDVHNVRRIEDYRIGAHASGAAHGHVREGVRESNTLAGTRSAHKGKAN